MSIHTYMTYFRNHFGAHIAALPSSPALLISISAVQNPMECIPLMIRVLMMTSANGFLALCREILLFVIIFGEPLSFAHIQIESQVIFHQIESTRERKKTLPFFFVSKYAFEFI